jgi:N-acetylmuramoyl-L-alanine amidase
VIALLAWLLVPAQTVLVATPRGERAVPVVRERGATAVAAPLLARPLGLTLTVEPGASRATVQLGGAAFVFHVGAPFARVGGVVCPLVGDSYVARDTLFLPLTWLADCVPRVLATRYRWDAAAARLEERAAPAAAPAPVASAPAPTPGAASAGAANPLTGLRQRHVIVIDPGHGGPDPGNPGRHVPGGLVEKDIVLSIAKFLRAELMRRGLTASLTRQTDTLIDLADRGALCRGECDLFVSIHVNAMPPGRRGERVSGGETYFLSDAQTEDQERVAAMENDALRFETDAPAGALGFILRDLQLNEYLRESARLAELVQARVARVHPGGDRGVQQAAFMVLTTARRPAILVETGFATNPTDGAFLASALGQHKLAGAIAEGIVAYLLEFERKLTLGAPAGGR